VYQNKLGAQVELLDGSPLPAGDYKLLITVSGAVTEVPFTILSATQPANTISGTVRDVGGAPIAGAEVSATLAQGGQAPVSAQTAVDGTYSLEVSAGIYSVVAGKAGYSSPLPLSITVPPDRAGADFTLTPATYTVSGTVRDGSGNGISGAQVSATPAQGGQAPAGATTAADGSYSLSVAAGSYSVAATKQGYQAEGITVSVPPSQVGADLILHTIDNSTGTKVYLPLMVR
jgi:hypothetical protein